MAASFATLPPRPNAVQLDLGLGVVGLAYERFVERSVAVQVEAHVFGTWFGPLFDLPNMRGFGGQIRPSFFLGDRAPEGVYIAPFLRVDRVTTPVHGVEESSIGFSTGTFLGYSFLFGERTNLRIGAGLQLMSYVVDGNGASRKLETIFPALDLVLGWAF